jgi:hypothetical protein
VQTLLLQPREVCQVGELNVQLDLKPKQPQQLVHSVRALVQKQMQHQLRVLQHFVPNRADELVQVQ